MASYKPSVGSESDSYLKYGIWLVNIFLILSAGELVEYKLFNLQIDIYGLDIEDYFICSFGILSSFSLSINCRRQNSRTSP